MIRKIVAVIFWIFYLPCIPVRVPQRSIGFLPVGPAIVKESVQTPKVVSTMSKLVKSSLNWHISVIKTKISEYNWHYLVFFWHSFWENPGFVRDRDILWTQKCKLGTKIDQKISLICFTIFFSVCQLKNVSKPKVGLGGIQILHHQGGGWVGSKNENYWWFTVL